MLWLKTNVQWLLKKMSDEHFHCRPYPYPFNFLMDSLKKFRAFKRKKIQSRTGVKISLVPHLFKQVKTRAQYREPSGETG